MLAAWWVDQTVAMKVEWRVVHLAHQLEHWLDVKKVDVKVGKTVASKASMMAATSEY